MAGECTKMSADTESFKRADTDTETETDNFLSLKWTKVEGTRKRIEIRKRNDF